MATPQTPQIETTAMGQADAPARRIGFVLVPGYPLMSAASAVEPLRAANLLAGRGLYTLRYLSPGGGQASASAGSAFATEAIGPAVGDAFDLVFVVAGGNPLAVREPGLSAWLRRLDSRGVALGGISGGAALLAQAGVMSNRRFTLHWEHEGALRNMSDSLLIERRLFVIDRDRYTCAGGVAALDMMYALIAAEHGAAFARRVSDWFIHTHVRTPEGPQKSGLIEQYGTHHPALLAALELMESHVADPLSVEQLASLAGISARQLQRLFQQQLGRSAKRVYLDLRLAKADELLRQTRLAIPEVAALCGFASAAHFARTLRIGTGQTPSDRRRRS